MGGWNFRKILRIIVPKSHGGNIYVFWHETFKVVRFLLPGTWFLPFHYGYCWSHEHSHSKKTVKKSRRTQKVENYLVEEGSGLAFFSTELGEIFGSNVANEFRVMLRGKGPHKPEFAYNIVCTHSFMIYTDLIKYIIVGDTKSPLLRCFLFIPKRKPGGFITTWQNMNYQTISSLQFRPLLKSFFHSIHIDFRDKERKNTLCISRYHSFCFDVQKSLQISYLPKKTLQDGCFKTSRDSIL